ncbi:2-isopropylmalate synthase [Oscillospiraceae bacterium OttesenSCG-928-G22]|nr:2-isopropylmalate synthase [Oscillospiraceae bacterium OttesenSCG-928-G22]
MANYVKVFDTTLRDGEQAPGFSMDFVEKLDLARQLEAMKVDIIEAGFPVSSDGDFAAVQAISREIRGSSICGLARAVKKDIDAAWGALNEAAAPRIHLFLATSPVHMEYKLRMSPDTVLDTIGSAVAYAKKYLSDVQFSAEDACRSDRDFLVKAFTVAIQNGATTINIPDTVGYMTPWEMEDIVRHIRENTPGADRVDISIHCHNDLGMGTANTLAGVTGGATQVEVALNGIGERAGNAALEEVVMALRTRQNKFGRDCRLDTTKIYRASRLLQSVTGVSVQPNKAITGDNAFAHESGIHQHGMMANPGTYEIITPESVGIPPKNMVLGKHSGRHAFEDRLVSLGYSLDEAQLNDAFERFKDLSDKKKFVSDRDLESLLDMGQVEHPGRYSLVSFVINSGNTIDATAVVNMMQGEEEVQGVALGTGPVDAAFTAINTILKQNFELENYSLQSVTEGEDALGEATVRLQAEGRQMTGRGVSTDVIEASIKAYINGVNKFYSGE